MTTETTVAGALAIGPLEVWPPVVLAPMAGVTNPPFRSICREHGAGLYVSEMVIARAIVEMRWGAAPKGGKSYRSTRKVIEFAPGESPRSIQLYGTDAWSVGEAIRRLADHDHVDHVDLNFGCPVRKVTRHGGGSALPVKRALLASIMKAAVDAAGSIPVTVKFRKGVDDDHLTYLDTGRIAEDVGVAAIALHARTAEQLYSGTADWPAIARLKETVSSIPVLGNGDIWEAPDAIAMMAATGCDGVVVGRGCLGRPWLFGQLADLFDGREMRRPPLLGEVCDTLVHHGELLIEWLGHEADAMRQFRKHTGWYLAGYPVGSPVRAALNQVRTMSEVRRLLDTVDRSLPLPLDGMRLMRGHQAGPQKVTVPYGWFDDPDDVTPLPAEAAADGSGG
ncbi:MAG: tRNA dihydrouridine synthase DusB [Acidimicrobiia bacterium]